MTTLDFDRLLEQYKPEYPELLDEYQVDIESESVFDGSWHGKVYQENIDGGHFALCGFGNAGQGGCNNYYPIVFDEFKRFTRLCAKCYPKALEPMDFACMYLELREAHKQDSSTEHLSN